MELSERIQVVDALEFVSAPPVRPDLTMFSPPYEDQRTYGIGFNTKRQSWVDWMAPIMQAAAGSTNGPVICVVNGKTRKGNYSFTPERLAIQLQDLGLIVPKPPIFYRYGMCGKTNWLRDVYESIVVCARPDCWPLPYIDNTATGHAPKYERGGDFSNRKKDGTRIKKGQSYPEVKKTIETNVFHGSVGKGHMGDDLAHENEAPYPEWIVDPFIQCFCPPNGTVLDPFCGSGTTLAVAKKLGRSLIGCDVRQSQVDLTIRRLRQIGRLPT